MAVCACAVTRALQSDIAVPSSVTGVTVAHAGALAHTVVGAVVGTGAVSALLALPLVLTFAVRNDGLHSRIPLAVALAVYTTAAQGIA